MAEIKIEKKKPIWPWILGILILLAVIFIIWNYTDPDLKDERLLNDSIVQVDENNIYHEKIIDSSALYTGRYGSIRGEQAIADYLAYVDNNDRTSANEGYYRTAFFKLITATKREAEIQNVDVTAEIDSAMKDAEMLTNDPEITKTPDNIRSAAESVSRALKSIQQANFDDLGNDADAVATAANKIDAKTDSSQQQQNIDAFFDKAAVLLQRMNENENKNY